MNNRRAFAQSPASLRKLELFIPGRKMRESIQAQYGNFHGIVLDLGCGKMPYKQSILASSSKVEKYIGVDLPVERRDGDYSGNGPPDLEWDGRTIPVESNSIDCVICTEVYELCQDVESVMKETFRVLKPGGLLYFTVPFLWPVFNAPFDQYRFTPFALTRHLTNSGFVDIQMKSLGGWDASLGQMIGLWVRRRPLPRWLRLVFSIMALPVVRFLAYRDKPPDISTDQTMITHIAGTARKAP